MEPAPDTEEHRWRSALTGDIHAFGGLVERFSGPILNFVARMIGNPVPAEDITQMVFVRAWSRRGSYRPQADARVSTWLFTIARNLALDHLRSARRQPFTNGPLPDMPDGTTDPAVEAGRAELGRAIAAAVARLPDDQREVFILAEYHGFSLREIASMQDCTAKAAERRLYRARLFLRDALAQWRIEPGGKP